MLTFMQGEQVELRRGMCRADVQRIIPLVMAGCLFLSFVVGSVAGIDNPVGALSVTSVPPGASVSVDGMSIGVTPVSDLTIGTGAHTLRVSLPGYADEVRTITITEGHGTDIHVDLVPVTVLPTTVTVTLNTVPPGATVVFDGVNRGTTPVTVTGLSPGTHTARFSLAGYQEDTETLTLSAGSGGYTFTLSPAAQAPTTGGLMLNTVPPGATVVLDGVVKGTTPLTLTGLSPGPITVRFSLSGYEEVTEPMTVFAGQTFNWTSTLAKIAQVPATQEAPVLKVSASPPNPNPNDELTVHAEYSLSVNDPEIEIAVDDNPVKNCKALTCDAKVNYAKDTKLGFRFKDIAGSWSRRMPVDWSRFSKGAIDVMYCMVSGPDGDGDGWGDDCDNCRFVPNPLQENSDHDRMGDACDNCWYADNDFGTDKDGDCKPLWNQGVPYTKDPHCGDACDNCPDIYNPFQENSDSDKWGNACDNCWIVPNEDQKPSRGGFCDIARDPRHWNWKIHEDLGTSPYVVEYHEELGWIKDPECGDACYRYLDIDGDTILDDDDNCGWVYNPLQENNDGDTRGNACDNCWEVQNSNQEPSKNPLEDLCKKRKTDPQYVDLTLPDKGWISDPQCGAHCSDWDNDEIFDFIDNCNRIPLEKNFGGYNPSQIDGNGNGIGDACECFDNGYVPAGGYPNWECRGSGKIQTILYNGPPENHVDVMFFRECDYTPNNYEWTDFLESVVKKYNERYLTTKDGKPAESFRDIPMLNVYGSLKCIEQNTNFIELAAGSSFEVSSDFDEYDDTWDLDFEEFFSFVDVFVIVKSGPGVRSFEVTEWGKPAILLAAERPWVLMHEFAHGWWEFGDEYPESKAIWEEATWYMQGRNIFKGSRRAEIAHQWYQDIPQPRLYKSADLLKTDIHSYGSNLYKSDSDTCIMFKSGEFPTGFGDVCSRLIRGYLRGPVGHDECTGWGPDQECQYVADSPWKTGQTMW